MPNRPRRPKATADAERRTRRPRISAEIAPDWTIIEAHLTAIEKIIADPARSHDSRIRLAQMVTGHMRTGKGTSMLHYRTTAGADAAAETFASRIRRLRQGIFADAARETSIDQVAEIAGISKTAAQQVTENITPEKRAERLALREARTAEKRAALAAYRATQTNPQ